MDSPVDSQFLRRAKRDGTFDSICKECLATVAIVKLEIDLEKSERDHVCIPQMRYGFQSMDADSDA